MRKYVDDLLIFVGCGSITYAAWQFNPVLAWLVGGVFFLGAGLFLAYAKSRNE